MKDIAKYIDHTNLKQYAKKDDIIALCREAKEYGFKSVCINPCWVELAKNELENSGVEISSVVGFPLGAGMTEAKAHETSLAVANGASEIDFVMNIGRLKDGDIEFVRNEIATVKKCAKTAVLKVIIECCLLTDAEKKLACEACVAAGADFVKTSTGFSTGGATAEDVRLMRKALGNNAKIKAAGGIRDAKTAIEMIEAGADRIGTSSGVNIVKELEKE